MKVTLKRDVDYDAQTNVYLNGVQIGAIWKSRKYGKPGNTSKQYRWQTVEADGFHGYYDRKRDAVEDVLGEYLQANYQLLHHYARDVADEILNHQ